VAPGQSDQLKSQIMAFVLSSSVVQFAPFAGALRIARMLWPAPDPVFTGSRWNDRVGDQSPHASADLGAHLPCPAGQAGAVPGGGRVVYMTSCRGCLVVIGFGRRCSSHRGDTRWRRLELDQLKYQSCRSCHPSAVVHRLSFHGRLRVGTHAVAGADRCSPVPDGTTRRGDQSPMIRRPWRALSTSSRSDSC